MGRHERRRDVREFRREVQRDHILTHLLDVRCDLSAHPMLYNVVTAWTAAIPHRKPFCFCCRSNFAETARPGAYLFAQPPGAADIASVSVLCSECWRDLPEAKIDHVAARVLRALAPGGSFIDPR